MELTDFRLFDKASRNLSTLTLPLPWPTEGKLILEFVRQAMNKLLPDVVAFSNMWAGRPDLTPQYQLRDTFQGWSKIQIARTLDAFVFWIKQLKTPGEPLYYATYNLDHNRISNIFNFNTSTLLANFPWGKKNDDFISPIRYFCYLMGGPLTTVQRREVGGKNVWVLCTPKDVVPYAT